MGINLEKGGRINLSKAVPGLTAIKAGLGWDANKFDTGDDFDLDVSAFVLDKDGKALSPGHMVFYNNLKSPDGAVESSGDNRTGAGAGDDETISIAFDRLPAGSAEVSLIVTIHETNVPRKQNFGQVSKSYVRLYNDQNADIARYNLEDEFSTETALQVGSFVKNDAGEWSFKAVGMGYKRGLIDFVTAYGLS